MTLPFCPLFLSSSLLRVSALFWGGRGPSKGRGERKGKGKVGRGGADDRKRKNSKPSVQASTHKHIRTQKKKIRQCNATKGGRGFCHAVFAWFPFSSSFFPRFGGGRGTRVVVVPLSCRVSVWCAFLPSTFSSSLSFRFVSSPAIFRFTQRAGAPPPRRENKKLKRRKKKRCFESLVFSCCVWCACGVGEERRGDSRCVWHMCCRPFSILSPSPLLHTTPASLLCLSSLAGGVNVCTSAFSQVFCVRVPRIITRKERNKERNNCTQRKRKGGKGAPPFPAPFILLQKKGINVQNVGGRERKGKEGGERGHTQE